MELQALNREDEGQYCGCCGGGAGEAPKGEHGVCCNEQHDIKAHLPMVTAPDPVGDFDRQLIADARRLADETTEAERRQYLRDHDSPYADAEYEIMMGAIRGSMQHALLSLASGYERELKRAAELEAELAAMRRDRDEYARRANAWMDGWHA